MAEKLRTDSDWTLLTRREIRKFFRVNELTINRWLDRGLLKQVGEIPGDAHNTTKALFAVLDDKLVQKLHARLEGMDPVKLDADRLPSRVIGQAAEQPSDTAEPDRVPSTGQEKAERATTKNKRKKTRGSRKPRAKNPAVEEPRQSPTEDDTPPAAEDPFSTLQTAAEASDYPELAEALWDEQTLGALKKAADALSAEAERLSQPEQAAAELQPLEQPELPENVSLGQDMAPTAELETLGIDLEVEEDHGPQVINITDEQGLKTWTPSHGYDPAKERLLLQAELAEVKSLQQANLERMEARLANMENLVEELGLIRSQDLNIEATLDEIRGHVVVNESRRDILAASMSMISDSVQELRTYISAANRTAFGTAKRVQQLNDNLARCSTVPSPGTTSASGHHKETPVFVLGVGTLFLTLALALYFTTGNVHAALAGVFLANISACATIVLGRARSE